MFLSFLSSHCNSKNTVKYSTAHSVIKVVCVCQYAMLFFILIILIIYINLCTMCYSS